MSNNIIFNKKLEEYNKKYRNGRYKLLKYTKKEVEQFDKLATNGFKAKNYLLNGRKWTLIGDTYYEIPKAPRWAWFRNLNAGIQAATCLVGAGVVTTAVTVPTVLLNNTHIHEEEKKDESIHVESISCNNDFILPENRVIGYDAEQIGLEVYPLDATNKNVKMTIISGEEFLEVDNETQTLYGVASGNAKIRIEAVDNKKSPEPIEVDVYVRSPYVQISQTTFNNQLDARLNLCRANAKCGFGPKQGSDFDFITMNDIDVSEKIEKIETDQDGGLYIYINGYSEPIPYNAIANEKYIREMLAKEGVFLGYDNRYKMLCCSYQENMVLMDCAGFCNMITTPYYTFCCARAVMPQSISKGQFIQYYLNYAEDYKTSINRYRNKYDIEDLWIVDPSSQDWVDAADDVKSLSYSYDENNNPSLNISFYSETGYPSIRIDACKYTKNDLENMLDENGEYYLNESSGIITYSYEDKYLEVNDFGYITECDDYEIYFWSDPYNYSYLELVDAEEIKNFFMCLSGYRKEFLEDDHIYYPLEVTYSKSGDSYDISFVNYQKSKQTNLRECVLADSSGSKIDEVGSAFADDTWAQEKLLSTGNYYYDLSTDSLVYINNDAKTDELRNFKISKNGYIEEQFEIGGECRSISYYQDPHAGISLNKTELSLNVGDSFELIATVNPSSEMENLKWHSSDENVVTIGESGKKGNITVNAVGKGTAKVTASIGRISVSCTFTVGEGGEITRKKFTEILDNYCDNFKTSDLVYESTDLAKINLQLNGTPAELTGINYGSSDGSKNCCTLTYKIGSQMQTTINIDAVSYTTEINNYIEKAKTVKFRKLEDNSIITEGEIIDEMTGATFNFIYQINQYGYMNVMSNQWGAAACQFDIPPHKPSK